MTEEKRVPSNAEILERVVQVDSRLNAHIETEEPILMQAKTLLDLHGDSELLRARIAFINAWMVREQQRAALRRAIIEKTTIGAIWAVLVYLAILVKEDITVLLVGMRR